MPKFKKNKSAFMMKPKSPMMKALVGKQKNLPEELQAAIIASPSKMGHSPKKHMVDDMYASSNMSTHFGKMTGAEHNAKHTDEEFRKKRTAELKAGAAASPKKKYKSAAQRKAVHASKAEAAMKMYGKKKK